MTHPSTLPATPPETIHMLDDPASGLKGVVVLHSTWLGPAAGGCRLWHYDSAADLQRDALRLAEGMACKNALAGLPLGGGKAVLQVPHGAFDRDRLFAAFGREVALLDGRYVTAEDVGTTVADMQAVRSETQHVAGLDVAAGKPGGDPSPWTALGVFLAMQEAVRRRLGRTDMDGLTVAVQGLGNVGSRLCALLHDAGAKLVVADTRSAVAAAVACRFDATVASVRGIAEAPVDVFAPCALGGVMDADAVARLQAKVVCGGANNVLATPGDGDRLAERGVLYAPDYVANAGGIINVAAEYLGWSCAEAERRVRETGQRLAGVFDLAEREGLAPHRAADLMARRMLTAHGALLQDLAG